MKPTSVNGLSLSVEKGKIHALWPPVDGKDAKLVDAVSMEVLERGIVKVADDTGQAETGGGMQILSKMGEMLKNSLLPLISEDAALSSVDRRSSGQQRTTPSSTVKKITRREFLALLKHSMSNDRKNITLDPESGLTFEYLCLQSTPRDPSLGISALIDVGRYSLPQLIPEILNGKKKPPYDIKSLVNVAGLGLQHLGDRRFIGSKDLLIFIRVFELKSTNIAMVFNVDKDYRELAKMNPGYQHLLAMGFSHGTLTSRWGMRTKDERTFKSISQDDWYDELEKPEEEDDEKPVVKAKRQEPAKGTVTPPYQKKKDQVQKKSLNNDKRKQRRRRPDDDDDLDQFDI